MNKNLEKVIRVVNHRDLLNTTKNKELARLSGLTVRTISRQKNDIILYAKTAPQPSKEDEKFVNKQLSTYYIEIAIKHPSKSKYHYSNILGAIAGYVLRQETDLINDVQQTQKVINIGLCVMNLASQIQARKDIDGKGTSINSQGKYVKYLLNECNKIAFVDKLFTRSGGYSIGNYSKRWKLSAKAVKIVDRVVELVFDWMQNVPVMQTHIVPTICTGMTRTLPPTNTNPLFITLPFETIKQLSLPSILQILNHSQLSQSPVNLDVSLANQSTTDPSIGRHYNIFTRLRSAERKQLGYINYDISGGLQTISLQILHKFSLDPNLYNTFSFVYHYAVDPKYKSQVRQEIATALNISVSEVKALLTAYANGGNKDKDKHKSLTNFHDESDLLRRNVISTIAQYAPDILLLAQDQSKRTFPIDFDWKSTEQESSYKEAKNKASIFFFIWTYYEKQIRDAMLSVVNDGISVHDAIYSKQEVPFAAIEDAVYKETGFVVKIAH